MKWFLWLNWTKLKIFVQKLCGFSILFAFGNVYQQFVMKKEHSTIFTCSWLIVFLSGKFHKVKTLSYYTLKVLEGNLKNVCQNAIKKLSHLSSHYIFSFLTNCASNVWIFRYHVIKMNELKNRLVFAYYNILTFYCLKKSLQNVLKTWQVLKWKNHFFWKMSKYQNTVFYHFKSQFLVIFFSNYRHHLVLKIPFPDHIFLPKISKYRTENLHFPSTGK